MPTDDLYSQSLSTLNTIRETMLSAEFMNSLEGASPDVRTQAALKLIDVDAAIAKLSNDQLSNISAQMDAEGPAIQAAIADMKKAQQNVAKVAEYMCAVTSFISTVTSMCSTLAPGRIGH